MICWGISYPGVVFKIIWCLGRERRKELPEISQLYRRYHENNPLQVVLFMFCWKKPPPWNLMDLFHWNQPMFYLGGEKPPPSMLFNWGVCSPTHQNLLFPSLIFSLLFFAKDVFRSTAWLQTVHFSPNIHPFPRKNGNPCKYWCYGTPDG